MILQHPPKANRVVEAFDGIDDVADAEQFMQRKLGWGWCWPLN